MPSRVSTGMGDQSQVYSKPPRLTRLGRLVCVLAQWVYYYYYYYYRKKRFRWHNAKRLQGHLTNTKQNSTSATQQNEQSIYQIQTAAEYWTGHGHCSGRNNKFCVTVGPVTRITGCWLCWPSNWCRVVSYVSLIWFNHRRPHTADRMNCRILFFFGFRQLITQCPKIVAENWSRFFAVIWLIHKKIIIPAGLLACRSF